MSVRTHLSRLTLKRDAADVAPLLQDLLPKDEDAAMGVHHRLLWTVFDGEYDGKATSANFLWRHMSQNDRFILLGPEPRHQSPWFKVESKPMDIIFQKGQQLAFDLRVNATVNRRMNPGKENAVRKRSDIVIDAMHREERDNASISSRKARRHQVASKVLGQWMTAQGYEHGYEMEAFELQSYRTVSIPRNRSRPVQLGVSDVMGQLRITDPQAFLSKLHTGFGRSKAFGCGLMLVRPT